MIELRQYADLEGRVPFRRWFDDLDAEAAVRVQRSLSRFASGNTSHVRSVGEGVHEVKVDFGPGYRVYFGWDGNAIVILLGGGSKKRQDRDIATAHGRWVEYKRRK
jgi:putative addiction module killer protein